MLEPSTIAAPTPLMQIFIDQYTNIQENPTATTRIRKIASKVPNHEPLDMKILTKI